MYTEPPATTKLNAISKMRDIPESATCCKLKLNEGRAETFSKHKHICKTTHFIKCPFSYIDDVVNSLSPIFNGWLLVVIL